MIHFFKIKPVRYKALTFPEHFRFYKILRAGAFTALSRSLYNLPSWQTGMFILAGFRLWFLFLKRSSIGRVIILMLSVWLFWFTDGFDILHRNFSSKYRLIFQNTIKGLQFEVTSVYDFSISVQPVDVTAAILHLKNTTQHYNCWIKSACFLLILACWLQKQCKFCSVACHNFLQNMCTS